MPIAGGRGARHFRPRAPVFVGVFKARQMAVFRGRGTRIPGPLATVLVRINQTRQLSVSRGRGARAAVPRQADLMGELQTVQMAVGRGHRTYFGNKLSGIDVHCPPGDFQQCLATLVYGNFQHAFRTGIVPVFGVFVTSHVTQSAQG